MVCAVGMPSRAVITLLSAKAADKPSQNDGVKRSQIVFTAIFHDDFVLTIFKKTWYL